MSALATVDGRPGASHHATLPTLRARGLGKRYGTIAALSDVTLDFWPGHVHVLFGENGAGKSTLISMLAGARLPSTGEIEIDGFKGRFDSVAEARRHGVRAVFQEFSLVPRLTVAQNIVLGEEPTTGVGLVRDGAAREEARQLIGELGFDLDVDAEVYTLPRGKQQMVEICKAMRAAPRLLILDEPTASLSEHDARALFDLVRRLKAQGTSIIYTTHRMHEIPVLGEQLTVLRDGKHVATVPAATPQDRLIELMTGRAMANIYPQPRESVGAVRLELEGLSLAPAPGVVTVRDANLTVRAGEVVGIAGLVGCGKSELGQACFGLRSVASGKVRLDGRPVRFRHPAEAIAAGLWYSPADRKADGLAMMRPARENMSLSGLRFGRNRGALLQRRAEQAMLERLSRQVDFNARRLDEPVSNFSGGNQQKVLLAKGLAQDIGVYLFDEPTVGVDVGARLSIYQCIDELSQAGAAVVLISSDLPELLGLSHRILVMNQGCITAEFAREAFDEHLILEQFF